MDEGIIYLKEGFVLVERGDAYAQIGDRVDLGIAI